MCLFPGISLTQTTTAKLVGTVRDSSGALVKNAEVTLLDERTGTQRVVRTNDDGLFIAVSLPPSSYDIKVSAAGFSTTEAKNLTLAVGEERTQDFALPVQGADVSVTVDSGGISLLDSSSARIGGNVSSREIEDLPINGRQISQLYLLVPGATNSGTGTFDNIRFSGRAVEQNILRLDGIEATSIIDTSPGNLNGELTSLFRLQQSLEAVQEFRIDSSSYPAHLHLQHHRRLRRQHPQHDPVLRHLSDLSPFTGLSGNAPVKQNYLRYPQQPQRHRAL